MADIDILPRVALPVNIQREMSRKSSTSVPDVQDGRAGSRETIDHSANKATRPSSTAPNTFKRYYLAMQKRENVQLGAAYWCLAAAGWNDASVGPLVPYIEEYFRLSYTAVATIFIASCIGSICAGLLNNRMHDKFGLGKTVTIGAVLQLLGYCVIIAPPPFPVYPPTFAVIGVGIAWQDAGTNVFVAGLPNASIKLGWLHGAYGIGALCAPLVATAFVEAGILWSRFFAVSLAVALSNVLILFFAFVHKQSPKPHDPALTNLPEELELQKAGSRDAVDASELPTGGVGGAPALVGQAEQAVQCSGAKDREILKARVNWLITGFLMLYVGCEVSLGGWCVAYLIDTRSGGVSVGYVASGFWSGLALSRVLLPHFNLWVGERTVIFLYLLLACGLEVSIWTAKSLIANAVAFALCGFMLGPLYPCAISVLTKIVPKHLGSAGAAIFPFVTGALSSRYGTWVLQPVVIALLASMALIWAFVPSPSRRKD